MDASLFIGFVVGFVAGVVASAAAVYYVLDRALSEFAKADRWFDL